MKFKSILFFLSLFVGSKEEKKKKEKKKIQATERRDSYMDESDAKKHEITSINSLGDWTIFVDYNFSFCTDVCSIFF